jgi:hypothetical protein
MENYINTITEQYEVFGGHLNERDKRLWLASQVLLLERLMMGSGNPTKVVVNATGASYNTVTKGQRELKAGEVPNEPRQRKLGGGRKKYTERCPGLLDDLKREIEPTTRGDPETTNKWHSISTRNLVIRLKLLGYSVSHVWVAMMLSIIGYSLQANSKVVEAKQYPDRDKKFTLIDYITKLCRKKVYQYCQLTVKRKK